MALNIPVVGTGANASLNMAKQNSNNDYASVNEQSGIQAGTDGFAIIVRDNTNLKSAVITSKAEASKNSLLTETLTTSDI